MPVARAATIRVICAIRKKRGKHAMLHMKHRHVLMDRQLKSVSRFIPQQRQHFLDIQIIRNRQLIEAPLPQKNLPSTDWQHSVKNLRAAETLSDGRRRSSPDSESGPHRVGRFQSTGKILARRISEFAESQEMHGHDRRSVQPPADKGEHPRSRHRSFRIPSSRATSI